MTHIKPTKEELAENAAKALEEAEALETKEEPEKKQAAEAEQADEQVESVKDEQHEENSDDAEEEKEVDYKKKFVESTREAQVLHSKNKKITQAIEKANSLAEPSEEELSKEYGSEWEEMSTLERRFARDNFLNKRKFELLSSVTADFKEADTWSEKIEEFIADPKVLTKHPELDGQDAEFIAFATKPSRRGVDMEDLVSAFLYQAKPTKRHKGALIEEGTGGDKTTPKDPSVLTVEEGRRLRTTDYKKWVELSRAGKIRQESL